MWKQASAAGSILLLTFGSLEYHLSDVMVFSASTHASEVRLVGNGTVLRASHGSCILTMFPGAPPVSLHGFTLHNQLDIQDGLLKMEDCIMEGISSVDGGALRLIGGTVEAHNTRFIQNVADRHGGAVYVDGGSAHFSNCLFQRNVAWVDGGALFVRRGFVALGGGTLLASNSATGRGNSIFVHQNASGIYKLPCPLGHWIDSGSRATSARIRGSTDVDYPFACVRRCACQTHPLVPC